MTQLFFYGIVISMEHKLAIAQIFKTESLQVS